MLPIHDVAARLGLSADDLIPYGRHKAKIERHVQSRVRPKGKLVLVSAITPTPAGEGKTTTTIGLGQALQRLGQQVCVALREPSLGPCFGVKGGGTGGGQSMIIPSEDINLHFNGDFHAITAAHNLLAALIDNHLHFRNEPALDPRKILWKRVLDVNDRSLRNITLGLGGSAHGVPREGSFDITAASEVMAALCLAADEADLRVRLGRIVVGLGFDGKPVRAAQLGAVGPMMALLKDALLPNLVQTTEGVPAIVHGGPFANIAHGCNSLIATKLALGLADWVVTEAGFGFDLGGEKFFDLLCTSGGLDVAAVVLVATSRALRMHGGAPLKAGPDAVAVEKGLSNLAKQVENVRAFGFNPVVALNRVDDSDAEIEVVRRWCAAAGVRFALSEHYARGGAGAEALAKELMAEGRDGMRPVQPLYAADAPLLEKIRAISTKIYGAKDVILAKTAEKDLADLKKMGADLLPVCMAKTQNSLSDDPTLLGAPTGFTLTVRNLQLSAGAGFIVVLTGEILRMPGLPKLPSALAIDLVDGEVRGLH